MEKKDYIKMAAVYLELKGYEVLERQWNCPAGAADIIARSEDGRLVFAEVNGRDSAEGGFPPEDTSDERRDIAETVAALYLMDAPIENTAICFDTISLISYGTDKAFFRHHQNAYGSGLKAA